MESGNKGKGKDKKSAFEDENSFRDAINSWLEGLNSFIKYLENQGANGVTDIMIRGIPLMENKLRAVKEFRKTYDELVEPINVKHKRLLEAIKAPAHWNSGWYGNDIKKLLNLANIKNAQDKIAIAQRTLDINDAIVRRLETDEGGY